ncbi:MAG TPA: FAD-dependent thymidylate synthase [Candidatus Limnocylindrales bacterium]|nr:FAD-dependent thymidylate synthase [Candidatus Limnocylindrales bacterium]
MSVPELDSILGVEHQVLDAGFVRVIDYMGGDDSIVQAARVSYGEGTKRAREDAALIHYLLRHRHTTPFEMCEIKLHVRVPMDCWRQWIRHRTANVNEYSTRYSVAIDAAQRTRPTAWRSQSASNRQGSEGFLDEKVGSHLSARADQFQRFAKEIYDERLAAGVAREQARKDLPLSTYTEAYWKIDLHNLLHFLHLRMAPDAQFEIRQYANVIGHQIVARWCPTAWAAFSEHRMAAVVLSSFEQTLISEINGRNLDEVFRLAESRGWVSADRSVIERSRERQEFERKVAKFGLDIPWTSHNG